MKIFEDTLNQNSASIQSDEYGMRAYVNSSRGRVQLETECTAEIVADVYKTWGDTPTVTEPVFESSTEAATQPSVIDLQTQIFSLTTQLVTAGVI